MAISRSHPCAAARSAVNPSRPDPATLGDCPATQRGGTREGTQDRRWFANGVHESLFDLTPGSQETKIGIKFRIKTRFGFNSIPMDDTAQSVDAAVFPLMSLEVLAGDGPIQILSEHVPTHGGLQHVTT